MIEEKAQTIINRGITQAQLAERTGYGIFNTYQTRINTTLYEKFIINQHTTLDSANKKVYNIAKNKGREPKEVRN